jgi:hypothetical protein
VTRIPRLPLAFATCALALFAVFPAHAGPLRFGPFDNTSLFTISKSENKNEVVYAIHLDAQCAPVGDAPVFAFWHMVEKGPHVIEPLLSREERAYGIDRQQVVSSGADGGKVTVTLKALATRPIVIETKRGDGKCEAWSKLKVSGEDAYLYNVYVKLGVLEVDYLLLSGWAMDRQRVLHERVAR